MMSPGIRVLLIEDDPDDTLLTEEYLADAAGSYHVTSEHDAQRGADLLVEESFDVCLLDYQLGALTGLQVLADARRRGSETPVIMLTGIGDALVDINATVGGASDFLEKRNIDARSLERAIRYAIARNNDQRKIHAALRELEQAHEQLRTQNEQLSALNEFKDRMLGVAAHDLRTPLSAITGWLYLLKRGKNEAPLSEKRHDMVVRIEQSVDFMLNLVNEVLDHATLEAGAVKLRPRLVEPQEWLDTLMSRHASKAAAKDIALSVELGDLPSAVTVDPQKLEQAVSNLVDNAIKYSPPATTVKVRAQQTDDSLQIDVIDEGEGISPKDAHRIFEPFAKVQHSDTAEKSTGLGLSIAHQIVHAHGGALEMTSAADRGTTFTLRVPIGTRPRSTAGLRRDANG